MSGSPEHLFQNAGSSPGERHQRAQVERMLDRLRITPQRFFDLAAEISRGAVTTVDDIQPTVTSRVTTRWPATALYRINADRLNQSLRTRLNATGVGYCYMIKRQGKILHTGASGWARFDTDGPVAWAAHVPMNMASVSKFVTAIAIVKLLRAARIPLTASIGRFLPGYWIQGTGAAAITFHELLRHEAGLGVSICASGDGTFAEAKGQIAQGPSASIKGIYTYKNANFTILRVLFATLTGALDPAFVAPAFLGMSNDTFWDAASAMAYADYVNDNVFAPASIASRDFSADADAALAYATPPAAPGTAIVDGPGGSGQSGWHLSIGELARLLDEFSMGSIMPKWRAEGLLADMYGLDQPFSTGAGTVHTKGGRKLSGVQGMDSAIYVMPGGLQLAVYVNSWDGTQPGHLGGIRNDILGSVEFIFS